MILAKLWRRLFGDRRRAVRIFAVLLPLVALAEYARQIPVTFGGRSIEIDTALGRIGKTPDPSPGVLKLLVVGDTGLGSPGQGKVAELLETLCAREGADAMLMLGDNFYYDGVSNVDDPLWEERFHKYYDSPCLKGIAVFPVLGNHDYDGNPAAQIKYTEKSGGRWRMPSRAYTLFFDDVLSVAAVDTNFPDRCYLSWFCSLDWLERDLKVFRTPWRIAIGHHPAVSGGKYVRLKPFPRITLPPFLCRNGFDVYFAGHDHNFQDIVGRNDDMPCEIRQVVMGNGGAELTKVHEVPGTRFGLAEYGAGVATFTPDAAKVSFYVAEGAREVHSFTLTKGTK